MTYCNAQNWYSEWYKEVKRAEAKAKQEKLERERKERERIKKAQLSFNDMLLFIQNQDVEYVDNVLSSRGWKLHSTNLNGNPDNDGNMPSTYKYNDIIPSTYKTIVWTFDKQSYNNLAKGWFTFYLYPSYDNAVSYTIADETHLANLKAELIKSGYKKVNPTDIITRGIESIYRNSVYEVNFKKVLRSEGESGSDIRYIFFIYNFKQINNRKIEEELLAKEKAEQEKIARQEAERLAKERAEEEARIARQKAELDAKYNAIITRAETAFSQKQYAIAKQAYEEAIELNPENREMLSAEIAYIQKAELDAKYNAIITRAETAYSQKQYAIAKQAYEEAIELKPENRGILSAEIGYINVDILCDEAAKLFAEKHLREATQKYNAALAIKPNKKTAYINNKMNEIADLEQFLHDRIYKKYDYETLKKSDYEAKHEYIERELKTFLMVNDETVFKTKVDIVCDIDTLGYTTFDYTTSFENKKLNNILDEIGNNMKLITCYSNDYTINARATFTYTLEYSHTIVTAKKRPVGTSINNDFYDNLGSFINSKLYSAPYGNYIFSLDKATVNGQQYERNKLIKATTRGGSNCFWSLLIPGLGDHRVTYGYKKGVGVAISTYLLIGGGITLKFYSESEYNLYHKATTQKSMDNHYLLASIANYGFYGCLATAGIVWVSDFFWVMGKGAKNHKTQRAFKQSYLGAYYDPNMKVTVFSYTYNF
ncbi:MAG: hypothetical protein LBR36_09430 [Bacteroidales bacterium]|nr:hypothetical protein [Bacteroidales bacterium]